MIIKILWLLFGHYILDYPLQGNFLATTKDKFLSSMLAHVMIYSTGMSLIIYYNNLDHYINNENIILIWIIIFQTHMVIDQLKCQAIDKTKSLTTYLYIDQFAHIIINIFAMIIL